MITEIRLLPPLVIARLGGAPTPMDNYDVELDPQRPLGRRVLRPAPTLQVDPTTGAVSAQTTPDELRFTEDGLVRPVAPFLEVWARVDGGDLEPLTTDMLSADGLAAADVRWRVEVANHKASRRTFDADDRVSADTGEFSDHDPHRLDGTAANFLPGARIPFGSARFVRPTAGRPEIRLRFTPAAGHVFGARSAGEPDDPNVVAAVYDADRGRWRGHVDSGLSSTAPGGIYAQDADGVSLGYLDDSCDGVVRVAVGGRASLARIGVGPPTYSPESLPIRSVLHELEQVLLGPAVAAAEADPAEVEEIVRRAFESVRLMHTPTANEAANGMAGHDAGAGRRFEPILSRALVDTGAVDALHASVLAALRAGTAPWFADVLRGYDEVGDLTDHGRARMPAMMRGADGRHLALTRRQVELVRALVRGPIFPDGADGGPGP